MKKKDEKIDIITEEIFNLKAGLTRLEKFILDLPNIKAHVRNRDEFDKDELFEEAKKIVQRFDRASASLIQRRLMIGYARAARLLDQLETAGIVSAGEGSLPREVLKKK